MDMPPAPDDLAGNIARRLRMLEEAHGNTRKKIELYEQNSLGEIRKVKGDVSDFISELDDVKRQIKLFKNDLLKIIGELQSTAKKEQVERIEKYVELWEPIKFVTQNEVTRIVDYAIEKKMAQMQGTVKSPIMRPIPTRVAVEEDDDEEEHPSLKPKKGKAFPDMQVDDQTTTRTAVASSRHKKTTTTITTNPDELPEGLPCLPQEPDTSLKKKKDLDEML